MSAFDQICEQSVSDSTCLYEIDKGVVDTSSVRKPECTAWAHFVEEKELLLLSDTTMIAQ